MKVGWDWMNMELLDNGLMGYVLWCMRYKVKDLDANKFNKLTHADIECNVMCWFSCTPCRKIHFLGHPV